MRPNAMQFGHLGLEIMYGLRLATRLRAPLWLIRPDRVVNTALYGLSAEGVTIKVFDGWAGRLLTRAFFPDHIWTLHLLGLGTQKDAILYGTPFHFLVSLRIQVFVRSFNFNVPVLPATLLTWMADFLYRSRKRLTKSRHLLVKSAHRFGKRTDRRRIKLQRGVRQYSEILQRRFGRLWYRTVQRCSKRIHRIRKSLKSSLATTAWRLKAIAAGRGTSTATCLLALRTVCLRLSALVEPSQVQPDAVPPSRERTNAEVAPRSPGDLDEAGSASIAALEPLVQPSTGVIVTGARPLHDATGVELARPGPATLTSPEDQAIGPAQGEEADTPPSVDQALAEPEDIQAAHERIDLYRVANDVSPARAVAAYMTKVRKVSTYYKRMWLARTPRSRIPADLLASLEAQAEKHLGIHPEARIVGLHVREAGFKAGREVHDVKPEHPRNDAVRNVTTANYRPALDFLSRQGFTIVRIGDPTMTPLQHPGVVDLALSPARTDLLETYCIERSACFIGCESGPVVVACMFQKPHLVLNATDPLAVIPIREGGIFTFQTVREIATGRMLSPLDMLFPDYLHNLRNSRVFDYFENGQEDVLAAVTDLLEIVERGTGPETPEQREFRLWALGVGVRLRLANGGVGKWGPHCGYLGGGRIAASFARKYVGPHLVAAEDTALRPPGALAAVS